MSAVAPFEARLANSIDALCKEFAIADREALHSAIRIAEEAYVGETQGIPKLPKPGDTRKFRSLDAPLGKTIRLLAELLVYRDIAGSWLALVRELEALWPSAYEGDRGDAIVSWLHDLPQNLTALREAVGKVRRKRGRAVTDEPTHALVNMLEHFWRSTGRKTTGRIVAGAPTKNKSFAAFAEAVARVIDPGALTHLPEVVRKQGSRSRTRTRRK